MVQERGEQVGHVERIEQPGKPGQTEHVGLREIKRRRTYESISETAIALFLERGFDQVSVVDVAAAAEVSKPTLFRYFPTKEDLVVHRFGDHRGAPAAAVRTRREGEGPLAALARLFLDGLAERDPITGLSDLPEVLAFHGLVYSTPGLVARVTQFVAEAERELAAALAEVFGGRVREVTAELLAAQVMAVQRVLAVRNWRRIAGGASADAVYGEAVADAEHAFAVLERGTAQTVG